MGNHAVLPLLEEDKKRTFVIGQTNVRFPLIERSFPYKRTERILKQYKLRLRAPYTV